jgi:hypothetical protein
MNPTNILILMMMTIPPLIIGNFSMKLGGLIFIVSLGIYWLIISVFIQYYLYKNNKKVIKNGINITYRNNDR